MGQIPPSCLLSWPPSVPSDDGRFSASPSHHHQQYSRCPQMLLSAKGDDTISIHTNGHIWLITSTTFNVPQVLFLGRGAPFKPFLRSKKLFKRQPCARRTPLCISILANLFYLHNRRCFHSYILLNIKYYKYGSDLHKDTHCMASRFTLSLRKRDLLKRLMMMMMLLLVSGGVCGGFWLGGRLLGIRLGLRGLLLCRRPGLDLFNLLALRTRP